MTKIEAMYRWSGGTDYRHTCFECRNCVKIIKGKRTLYKCRVYGNTGSAATDWKASYIACKHFNGPIPKYPVFEAAGRQQDRDRDIPGQITIFDILGGQDG